MIAQDARHSIAVEANAAHDGRLVRGPIGGDLACR
jgi:hypothetical protein